MLRRWPTLALMIVALGSGAAWSHVNDRGMDYGGYKDHRGVSCCSKVHCRPATDYVDTKSKGYGIVRLLVDGKWISVPRYFVVAEDAKDGRAHWCGTMQRTTWGEWVPVPFCVILPPPTN